MRYKRIRKKKDLKGSRKSLILFHVKRNRSRFFIPPSLFSASQDDEPELSKQIRKIKKCFAANLIRLEDINNLGVGKFPQVFIRVLSHSPQCFAFCSGDVKHYLGLLRCFVRCINRRVNRFAIVALVSECKTIQGRNKKRVEWGSIEHQFNAHSERIDKVSPVDEGSEISCGNIPTRGST